MKRASSLRHAVILIVWVALAGPAPDVAASDAVGSIASIRATVTGVRFFEGASQPPPLARRRYDDRFLHNPGPWIYWELSLAHPAPGRRTSFTVEEVWRAPRGGVAYRNSRVFTLEPDWNASTWWGSARLVEGRVVTVPSPRSDAFRCRGVTGEWGPCDTTADVQLQYWPRGSWQVELSSTGERSRREPS